MFISWSELKSLKSSLEVFVGKFDEITPNTFLHDGKMHHWANNSSIYWATISMEIPPVSGWLDGHQQLVAGVLESLRRNWKMEIYLHKEYKAWYSVIRADKEVWVEEALYYRDPPDLWDQLSFKIKAFCHSGTTVGFNIEYSSELGDDLQMATAEFEAIMDSAETELI